MSQIFTTDISRDALLGPMDIWRGSNAAERLLPLGETLVRYIIIFLRFGAMFTD